ncbi:MAG TPA: NAD kinase [Prolixibacteraceae bacterium]|nr:NAD kinase [Prolixibacteraceae bacterium]
MRIAIYGNDVKENYISIFDRLFCFFKTHNIDLIISKQVSLLLESEFDFDLSAYSCFINHFEADKPVDLILSIGGDGTFLSSVPFALSGNIPIAGINCGRLGFLADISDESLEQALLQIVNHEYDIEERTLLQIIEPENVFNEVNYALNEIAVHKLDNSSMIQIETYINDEFLANYWADGLIIGTPTGSTAYSLSVGGPIIMPDLDGLVITPIAPHNLTVRPIVVPDDALIELRINGRGQQFMVSFDHRSTSLDFSARIKIKKAPFRLPIVKLKGQSFYSTLRNKLMWGIDNRN